MASLGIKRNNSSTFGLSRNATPVGSTNQSVSWENQRNAVLLMPITHITPLV
jgi:hypothetical protein